MSESPLDKMPGFDNSGLEAWIENKERSYEDRVIHKLIAKFGLRGYENGMRDTASQVTGRKDLTFDVFVSQFPDFPLRLIALPIPYIQQASLTHITAGFTKTNLYKRFTEALENREIDIATEAVGLVFRWPGTQDKPGPGEMILHNSSVEPRLGYRIILKIGRPVQTLYLESWPTFVEALTEVWYPT